MSRKFSACDAEAAGDYFPDPHFLDAPGLVRHAIISAIPPKEIDIRGLVAQCISGEPAAWRKLVAHFNPVIQAAVIRTLRRCGQLNAETADDLVQDTYLRLCTRDCKVLRDFRKSGSVGFYGLLQSVAISVTIDYIRTSRAQKRGGGQKLISIEEEFEASVPDPKGASAAENQVLAGEIDRKLRAILPVETADRDRRIFWLRYRHELTAKQIASLPGVGLSQEGVESALHRMTSKLKDFLKGFGEPEK